MPSDRLRSSHAGSHGMPISRHTTGTLRKIMLLVLILACGVSCEKLDSRQPRSNKRVRIALVGPSLSDSTWPVLAASAEWFSRIEDNVEIEVMAPEYGSALSQRTMMKELRDARYDMICVLPYDATGMAAVIRDIVRHGTTVITIGRDVPDSPRLGYCGPSEVEIGRGAASACAMVLEGRPKTIMLLHSGRRRDAAGKRLIGFESEIKNYPDLQVLKTLDCKGNAPDARHLVRTENRKYPRTGCWVFLDDWAYDALPAGERMLPVGSGIVLCHTSSEYFRLVDNGQVLALITYDLREAIDASLFLATEAAQEDDASRARTARNVNIECEIVTGKTMSEYRAKWLSWTQPDYREMP